MAPCTNFQIEGATRLAEIRKLHVKDPSTELRIGCVYLAPYGDSVVDGHTYFRARLEKVYGDGVGCNVKVRSHP